MFAFKSISLRWILTLIVVTASNLVIADDKNSYLTLGVGHVGIFDSVIDEPALVEIEYRRPSTAYWGLSPGVGYGYSLDNTSFLYTFVEKDFDVANNWVLSANFGFGLFSDGEDVKLGKDLQFRSGVRFSYRFDNDVRLGAGIFHLSNAGLGEKNPGTEPALITLYIPL